MIYRLQQSDIELLLNDKNDWYIIRASDDRQFIKLLPGVFLHRVLMILTFQELEYRRWYVVLSKDNLPARTFRRLSVRLRFGLSTADQ